MGKVERISIGDRIVIYQRGKKNIWVADFWSDGQHRKASLHTRNKRIAVQRAIKLEATIMDGSFHKPQPKILIKDAVEQYLDHLKTEDRASKTLVKYRGILDTLVSFLSAQHIFRMPQFTAGHFDKFRAFRKIDHRAKTMYTEGIVIKQFFRWGKKRKMILENPLEEIKFVKPRLEPKQGPTLVDLNTILANAKGTFGVILATLAFTGMRSGELRHLRKEDVDLFGGWIQIESRDGARTKTGCSRKGADSSPAAIDPESRPELGRTVVLRRRAEPKVPRRPSLDQHQETQRSLQELARTPVAPCRSRRRLRHPQPASFV